MGSGDWNDGMSTVGNKGKGESVWLGWFLYKILDSFEEICAYMNDDERKDRYLKEQKNLLKIILKRMLGMVNGIEEHILMMESTRF